MHITDTHEHICDNTALEVLVNREFVDLVSVSEVHA